MGNGKRRKLLKKSRSIGKSVAGTLKSAKKKAAKKTRKTVKEAGKNVKEAAEKKREMREERLEKLEDIEQQARKKAREDALEDLEEQLQEKFEQEERRRLGLNVEDDGSAAGDGFRVDPTDRNPLADNPSHLDTRAEIAEFIRERGHDPMDIRSQEQTTFAWSILNGWENNAPSDRGGRSNLEVGLEAERVASRAHDLGIDLEDPVVLGAGRSGKAGAGRDSGRGSSRVLGPALQVQSGRPPVSGPKVTVPAFPETSPARSEPHPGKKPIWPVDGPVEISGGVEPGVFGEFAAVPPGIPEPGVVMGAGPIPPPSTEDDS